MIADDIRKAVDEYERQPKNPFKGWSKIDTLLAVCGFIFLAFLWSLIFSVVDLIKYGVWHWWQ